MRGLKKSNNPRRGRNKYADLKPSEQRNTSGQRRKRREDAAKGK